MSEAKDFLEMVLEKRRKVRRMEEALAENTARAESVTGLAFTERVQTSNKSTIDATLAALEEERQKLVDAQNELEDMTERAKALINTVRDDEVTWQILWHRYILGESWKEMSARLHYSRTSLYLKLEQGLGLIQERLNTTEHKNVLNYRKGIGQKAL